MSASVPSVLIRRAVLGARPSKRLMAAPVWLRAQFQHLAQEHQGDDHGRRFEIEPHVAGAFRKEGGKIPGKSVATKL